jgi:DNA-binding MltR family transcriptional regulator
VDKLGNTATKLLAALGKLEADFYEPLQPILSALETERNDPDTSLERRKQITDQINEYKLRWEASKSFTSADEIMKTLKKLLEEAAIDGGFTSTTVQEVERLTKSLVSSSGQQTTGSNSGISGVNKTVGNQQTGALATLNKYAP